MTNEFIKELILSLIRKKVWLAFKKDHELVVSSFGYNIQNGCPSAVLILMLSSKDYTSDNYTSLDWVKFEISSYGYGGRPIFKATIVSPG